MGKAAPDIPDGMRGIHERFVRWRRSHTGRLPIPECGVGKVYRQKEPKTLVRIVVRPPLEATRNEMERLRCNGCGELYTADGPAEAGALGEVMHNDGTGMRILRLAREPADPRTGVFTSGIVSLGPGWKIALYFSGAKHAGENLAELLLRISLVVAVSAACPK